MNPNLQYAHAWLFQGPVRVPGLCDIIADYAKCWVEDIRHGSTFLIIGMRGAGKQTLLRDLLHRRSYHYKYGEIVTRLDMSRVGAIQVKQDVQSINEFLSKERRDVWIGFGLQPPEIRSNHLSTMVAHARHFKTDVILCAQSLLEVPAALRPNVDIVFAFGDYRQANRERLYENFFKSYYDDFAAFQGDFVDATENFGCLCLDRLKSKVVHFRANRDLEPFSMMK